MGVGDVDLGLFAMLVALVAAIDIGPLDGDAGETLNLLGLHREPVSIIGITGQGLHANDELAACGARVGDRDRCFEAELLARPRLALGDAFHLGRMQRVELVGSVRLLGQDLCHPLTRDRKGGVEFFIADDLAADVAVEPTEPGAQFAYPAHGLLVPTTVDRLETSRRACRPTCRNDWRTLSPCLRASRFNHSMPRISR